MVDPLEAKLGRRARILLPLMLLAFVGLSAWHMWPGRQVEPRRFAGDAFGATYNVTIAALPLDEEAAAAVDELITGELAQIDRWMSNYRADSDLARFNAHRATTPVALPGPLVEVLALAVALGRETGGALDVTVGPLVDAWGFGPAGPGPRPPADALARFRAAAGFDKLTVDRDAGTARKAHPELAVDLSSIAPGYAADRIADALVALGHVDCMVEVGGEVAARGSNHRGLPWQIAIEAPSDGPARRVHTVVGVSDAGLATSGDYRQRRELDGVQVSHTIDPRTGEPVAHAMHSVTVIAADAARADGLATAMMVLGPDAALAYAEEHDLALLALVGAPGGGVVERASPAFVALRGR